MTGVFVYKYRNGNRNYIMKVTAIACLQEKQEKVLLFFLSSFAFFH